MVQLLTVSAQKLPPVPAAWKNTYFWIAILLLGLGILALLKGDGVIRDPGQKEESGLAFIYLGGAAVMWLNGVLSHRHTVQQYNELKEAADDASADEGDN